MVLALDRPDQAFIPGVPLDQGPPEIDDILSMLSDGKEYFRPFHAQCEEEETYYYLEKDIPSPEGVGQIDITRPATAFSIINIGTDHVDVGNLSIDVPLASPRAKARAERLKKFYQGRWASIKKPVLRTAVRHAFIYGIAWIKDMFASDQWPDAPLVQDFKTEEEYKDALETFVEERNLHFVLPTFNVNPKNLIWDDSRIRPRWAIEFYEKDTQDIHRRYPEWIRPAQNRMTEWVEYWDETYVAYIANNQFVWGPEKHGYGFMPFIPLLPANALDYDNGPPERRYRGILKPVHSLLDAEARLLTQYEAIIRTVAWRTLDFHGPQDLATQTSETYKLFSGKNIVPIGVDVIPSPTIQVPNELLQNLSLVQTMIEEATFPNVIRGVRPKGVSTGFGISVLAGMGRLVFQGTADGLAAMVEQSNSHTAMLVENKARGKVTVHARSEIHNFDQSIGPDDIRGYYENIVKVKAEAPEEAEREARLAKELWNGGDGLISLYEAQRRARVLNPLEEQLQMGAERIMRLPEMQMMQGQRALQLLGLPNQLEQAAGGGEPILGDQLGSQNQGLGALPRPGEAQIQGQRMRTAANNERVFPQGLGGVDFLGQRLGSARGGAVRTPGRIVR